jgi:hypothetical protein
MLIRIDPSVLNDITNGSSKYYFFTSKRIREGDADDTRSILWLPGLSGE